MTVGGQVYSADAVSTEFPSLKYIAGATDTAATATAADDDNRGHDDDVDWWPTSPCQIINAGLPDADAVDSLNSLQPPVATSTVQLQLLPFVV